jgi:hypothetical protein
MWYTPVITALRKLKQDDLKYKASLGCVKRPISKNQGPGI